MTIARLFAPAYSLCALLFLSCSAAQAEVVKLELSPSGEGDLIAIRSRDARQQLIVTAVHTDGTMTDATRDVSWAVSDPKVVTIDSTGMATMSRLAPLPNPLM